MGAATLIRLDGSPPEALTVEAESGGSVLVKDVVIGEMPVLIRLREDP